MCRLAAGDGRLRRCRPPGRSSRYGGAGEGRPGARTGTDAGRPGLDPDCRSIERRRGTMECSVSGSILSCGDAQVFPGPASGLPELARGLLRITPGFPETAPGVAGSTRGFPEITPSLSEGAPGVPESTPACRRSLQPAGAHSRISATARDLPGSTPGLPATAREVPGGPRGFPETARGWAGVTREFPEPTTSSPGIAGGSLATAPGFQGPDSRFPSHAESPEAHSELSQAYSGCPGARSRGSGDRSDRPQCRCTVNGGQFRSAKHRFESSAAQFRREDDAPDR